VRPHAAQPAERTGPKVGEEAPEVRLADLGGKEVSLQNFKGKETLVLFWSPGALSGAPASHSLRSGSICWQKPTAPYSLYTRARPGAGIGRTC
jgi:hypothetical protein